MDHPEMSEVEDDDGGRVDDALADGAYPFPDRPEYSDELIHTEYLDQWYGAHTTVGPGSPASVTGEVLNAWFGADAATDPEAPKVPWDESLDEYAAADGDVPPWDGAESNTYA